MNSEASNRQETIPILRYCTMAEGNMFESADAYASMASDHLREARYMLSHYGHLIKGGDDEEALDVGCGTGEVTTKAIGTFRNWRQIVGVDFNPVMVDFSNQHNPDPEKYTFEEVNFNEPLKGVISRRKFDKIFSFFAMQWMNNRRNVAENIYDLLNPGGQAFLLLVAHSKIYEVWDGIAQSNKWKSYLKAHQPLNELAYAKRPDDLFRTPLKEVGLEILKSELIERKNVFRALEDSDESKIKKLKTVDPFLKYIPDQLRETYARELLDRVVTTVGPDGATDYTALLLVLQKGS